MNTFTINNVSNNVELGSFFESLLFTANAVLGLSVICIVVSILISYLYAEYFSMQVQISAHMSTIVVAAILKVSYVLRCVAQHGLGQEVR
ncbi:hypothetical protein PC2016_0142 [Pseudoalteromonas carrageenovora]|uniref:Orphan protein n=1 Tax=Pseudoalteromonas carrageenovora IAM 12662 TaxID=1314868 RepID=A0A2K4X540_PSEVC|nr:hypothetical protein [Pseudoalteromonas carrageenovora]MBE0381532.1 hypothetical protein [Pseudoalteromonas carrageenovora IAM 12662]QBJ70392.1 hypothetical protein PC2016_0142 [Pseudoalteromonas carrageenovora]GEB70556.1 hypothetical protein PCA01_12660 [Pseudoalteromonas carrageenovora]SOU39448.1 conserved protein of unknown function [Pseudoalteromonas carrageenovora IAM 12662]